MTHRELPLTRKKRKVPELTMVYQRNVLTIFMVGESWLAAIQKNQ